MPGRPATIREAAILDAARDVFREHGHASTTAKIALRAGVSEGILFYRYKSKEALLAALIERETEPPDSLREFVKRAAGAASVAKNLEAVIEILLGAVARAHPFMELAITSPRSGEIHRLLMSKSHTPPTQRMGELLTSYFAAEIRLGRVRAIDVSSAARAILGGCIEYVRSGDASDSEAGRSSFVRGLVDIFVHGITETATSRR